MFWSQVVIPKVRFPRTRKLVFVWGICMFLAIFPLLNVRLPTFLIGWEVRPRAVGCLSGIIQQLIPSMVDNASSALRNHLLG